MQKEATNRPNFKPKGSKNYPAPPELRVSVISAEGAKVPEFNPYWDETKQERLARRGWSQFHKGGIASKAGEVQILVLSDDTLATSNRDMERYGVPGKTRSYVPKLDYQYVLTDTGEIVPGNTLEYGVDYIVVVQTSRKYADTGFVDVLYHIRHVVAHYGEEYLSIHDVPELAWTGKRYGANEEQNSLIEAANVHYVTG